MLWHPTQAIGSGGECVDVRIVANGLKCNCVCFECKQLVIARQGPQLKWHFAHHAPTNCRPKPESELHFFAKSLLAERLWLSLPPVEEISPSRNYPFAEVKVEMADGNVRPDLILITNGGHKLHVEIFVRHKVDLDKLSKLQARNISSVEIDLSHLDWEDRDSWENAILQNAPRRWLHNAKAAEHSRLKAEKAAAEFQKYSIFWHSPFNQQPVDEQASVEVELAMKRGLNSMTSFTSNGARCFLVPERYWQSRLVNRFLWDEATKFPKAFETKHALAHVQHLVRPEFNRIPAEVAARMKEELSDFLTPWHTVHSYLKWLKNSHLMFDKRVIGKDWLPSSTAIHHRKEMEAEWAWETERKAELADWVDYILSAIPRHEHRHFDRIKWSEWFIRSYHDEDANRALQAIHEMVIERCRLAEDLIGLPLELEYVRQKQLQLV